VCVFPHILQYLKSLSFWGNVLVSIKKTAYKLYYIYIIYYIKSVCVCV